MSNNEEPEQAQLLSLDEIEEARVLIDLRHPLDELEVTAPLPFMKACKWCLCCKSRTNRGTNPEYLESLLKKGEGDNVAGGKKGMKSALDAAKKAEKQQKDPYLILGYGMIAYFDMLRVLIYVFGLITLLSLPSLFIYNSYDAMRNANNKIFSAYSLGNMGFSAGRCFTGPLGADRIMPSCASGTLSDIVSAGFIPGDSPDVNYCRVVNDTDAALCAEFIHQDQLQAYWAANCFGKTACTVEDLDSFLDIAAAPSSCHSLTTSVFIQAQCT